MGLVKSLEELRVLGFVGRGSCGLVKKVYHTPTNRILAIKVRVGYVFETLIFPDYSSRCRGESEKADFVGAAHIAQHAM